jgi:hypothetical protein
MLDASGQHLPAFFEGVEPNPRFSLARLAAENKHGSSVAICGSVKKPGIWDKLFSLFVRTAQAAEERPSCPTSPCSGDYMANTSWPCPGVGNDGTPLLQGQL